MLKPRQMKVDIWATQEGEGREDEAEAEGQVEEEKHEEVEGLQVFLERMRMGRVQVTMGCTVDTIRGQC